MEIGELTKSDQLENLRDFLNDTVNDDSLIKDLSHQAFDTFQKDGKLTKLEFENAYKEIIGKSDSNNEINRTFDFLDEDKDGSINETELEKFITFYLKSSIQKLNKIIKNEKKIKKTNKNLKNEDTIDDEIVSTVMK